MHRLASCLSIFDSHLFILVWILLSVVSCADSRDWTVWAFFIMSARVLCSLVRIRTLMNEASGYYIFILSFIKAFYFTNFLNRFDNLLWFFFDRNLSFIIHCPTHCFSYLSIKCCFTSVALFFVFSGDASHHNIAFPCRYRRKAAAVYSVVHHFNLTRFFESTYP